MTRRLILLFLLMRIFPAHAIENWSGLWRNADQRGEALLQKGDAPAAAKIFSDPQRKAYAEMSAGNYQAALHDLTGIENTDADYNRGNALAHLGDLPGAMAAYDAALKHDPHNMDARHNKELIKKALEQKKPPAQNKQNDQGKNGKQNDKDQGANGKPGDNEQEKNGKQGDKDGQKKQGGQPGQGKDSGQNPGSDNSNSGSAGSGNPQQAEQNRMNKIPPPFSTTAQSPHNAASKPNANSIDTSNPGIAHAPSENQLAKEQWLRGIPDDPGGLLRRKFLIEYMMRKNRP